MIDLAHLDAVAGIVGASHLVGPGSDTGPYEQGARHDRGRAAFVVRPADTREVSQVVAYCVRHAIHLVPQSGNTGLVSGSTPDMSGRQGVLSLERLRGLDLDPANRTARVGAGVRLSALNEALEPHGLFFPIDLGADPMMGGMVATNTGGARFLRYGDVRRNVLGLEVVLPDAQGTVLDLASPLRKNNVGADLKQLFIGSCGAFGVVTQAVVEVHRRPAQTATAILVPRDDDALVELLVLFEELAGEYLSAFEGMSRPAMQAAIAHAPAVRNPFARGEIPAYAVLVELTRSWANADGEAPLDAVLEGILTRIWERDDAPLADALVARSDEAWALRHAISEGLKASGHLLGFDLSFRRADLPAFRRFMLAELGARHPAWRVCDFGHVGDGGVHFNLVHPHAAGPVPRESIEALRAFVMGEAVTRFGGSFSAEHGLGRANQVFYDAYAPDALKRVTGALLGAITHHPLGTPRLGPPPAAQGAR